MKQIVKFLVTALILVGCGDGRLSPQGGTIVGVNAGTGLIGGAMTGIATLNVACGYGLTCLPDSIALDPAAVGGVDGSGTLNFVPLWTPDGNTLGDSFLSQTSSTVLSSKRLAVTVAGGTASLIVGHSTKSWTLLPFNDDLRLFEYTSTYGVGGGDARVTFEAGGNVGLGTTDPLARLDARGAGLFQVPGGSTPASPLDTATAKSGIEVNLAVNSLITLGDDGNAPNGNPALTMYRTTAGARQGTAYRLRTDGLTSSFQHGTFNAVYGAETYTDRWTVLDGGGFRVHNDATHYLDILPKNNHDTQMIWSNHASGGSLYVGNYGGSGFVRITENGGIIAQVESGAGIAVQDSTADSVAKLDLQNDVQLWQIATRGNFNDSLIIRDVTSGEDVLRFAQGGNVLGADDDTYFAWDAAQARVGWMKKAGATGKLAYGSASDLCITQSSGTSIDTSNTFTDRLCVRSTGNVDIGGDLTAGDNDADAMTARGAIVISKTALDSEPTLYLNNDVQSWQLVVRGASGESLAFRDVTGGTDECTLTTGGVLNCIGGLQVNGANVTAFSTLNAIPKGDGSGMVASRLSDSGTNITSTAQNFLIQTAAGTSPQYQMQQSGQSAWILYNPVSSNSLALYNSAVSDVTAWDGSGNATFYANLSTNGSLTSGDAAGDVFDHNGDLAKFGSVDGNAYVYQNSINQGYALDALGVLVFNLNGFANGTTQFRDTAFYDGKAAQACYLTGSTKTLNCVGGLQVNGANVTAFTTLNAIPKGDGSGMVASSWTDDGTTTSTALTTRVATTAGNFLNVGRDVNGTTDSQNGIGFKAEADGTNYIDLKSHTGGTSAIRYGSGTGHGYDNTWLSLSHSTGAATISGAVTLSSSLNVGTTGDIAGDLYARSELHVTGNADFAGSLTSGDAAGDVFDHNGTLATFGSSSDGAFFVRDNVIGWGYSTNAFATGYINYYGYLGSTTQFRDLVVGDGKGATACTLTGSTKELNCVGGFRINGALIASGTAGRSARFNAANTVRDGAFTDDGTNASIAGNLTSGDAAGDVFDHNGALAKFGSGDGYTFINEDTLNWEYGTDADATGIISYYGFNGGFTRFRNTIVADGKSNTIATFTGSDKSLAVVGALSTDSTLTVDGNATIGDAFTDSHSIVGRETTVTSAASAYTASNSAFGVGRSGTFDTTAGALTSGGANITATSTRSAGANNLTNRALNLSASGAQVNLALQTQFGDNWFNVSGGSSTFYANTQLGDASTDRVGIGIAPDSNHAMTFAAVTGNKIALYPQSATAAYGLGVLSGARIAYYTSDSAGTHSFGYGDSDAFTEAHRLEADGDSLHGIGTSNTHTFNGYIGINIAPDSNVGLKIIKPGAATYGLYVSTGQTHFVENVTAASTLNIGNDSADAHSLTGTITVNGSVGSENRVLAIIGGLPTWTNLGAAGGLNGAGTIERTTRFILNDTLGDGSMVDDGTNIQGAAADDSFFAWDFAAQRLGFTKKSGSAPKLTYGSATTFAIAQSSGATISAASTFTDRFTISSSGVAELITGTSTMTAGPAGTTLTLTQADGVANYLTLRGNNVSGIHFARSSSGATGGIYYGHTFSNSLALIANNASRVRITSAGTVTMGDVVSHTSVDNNVDVLQIANSGTAQTASTQLIDMTHTGSFNTTSAALTNDGINLSITSTRSAGANNLTNRGLYINVSGAQVNTAMEVNAGTTLIHDDATFGNDTTDTYDFAVNGPLGVNNYKGKYLEWVEEFMGLGALKIQSDGNVISPLFAYRGSGTNSGLDWATASRPGVANLNTGTTTTGWAAINSTPNVDFSYGTWYYAATAALGQLNATDSNESWTAFGFIYSAANLPNSSGCFFWYDRNNRAFVENVAQANADKWGATCRTSSAAHTTVLLNGVTQNGITTVDSPVAAAVWSTGTGVHRFEIVMTSNTSAEFKIDGTTRATITTNIPTGASSTGIASIIAKVIGTSNHVFQIDQVLARLEMTAARSP